MEDPVRRLHRFIRDTFWNNLTRCIDANGIEQAALDPKSAKSQPRIYIPQSAPRQFGFYSKIARDRPDMRLDVQRLPSGEINANYIREINVRPGLLALAMEEQPTNADMESESLIGLPFIVPGGRFNEVYYWDSCFCAWGMIESHVHIVKSILKHFAFEIEHFGKVLNGNRSYYLGRSQPPLLTDLAVRTYEATKHELDAKRLLKNGILAAIKEYHGYWTAKERYDPKTGLSRYHPIGAGLPPEVEPNHFQHILKPYAAKHHISIEEFYQAYNSGEIKDHDLDEFTRHDRALRESGHDTSNRLENVCADLATVDLNCLLYKYETDIGRTIKGVFDDELWVPKEFQTPNREIDIIQTSAMWDDRARKRRETIQKLMFNEKEGLFFDYNVQQEARTNFESVTGWAYPLWSGVASKHQAAILVNSLHKFECIGGVSSTTKNSRGPVNAANPQKQWDYPSGWPPHQMLAWEGLRAYGYSAEAERLTYRWLHMVTSVFTDYNGTVAEKYDVTAQVAAHKVGAEYGT